jgi:hypothetical protein
LELNYLLQGQEGKDFGERERLLELLADLEVDLTFHHLIYG